MNFAKFLRTSFLTEYLRWLLLAFMKTKENGKKNKCSIQDDKHLAEEVQEYPCLYDKGKKGYEEKMFEEQLSRNLASKKTIFFLD